MTEREKRDPRTHAIIGAAIEVHRQLGCGFLEAVYQEAMAVELRERGVPYLREVELLGALCSRKASLCNLRNLGIL